MTEFARLHRRLREKADDPAARPVLYVAIGDSVTQGCMEYGVIEHERVYHELLKRRIERRYPTTGISVINAGVSGDSASHSRGRWRRDVVAYQPDLVTISFGLNDAHEGEAGLEGFIAAIRDLVRLVRAETEADLLVLTPGMMMKADNGNIAAQHRRLVPAFLQTYKEGHLVRYVEALRQFAASDRVPCLDVYAMWEKLERDGVDIHARLSNGINHPDRRFHEQLAEALEAVLFSDV